MLLRGTSRLCLPLRKAPSKGGLNLRINTPRRSGARRYSVVPPPSSKSGPENWLGLGLPLVWWVAAGYGVTSLALGSYYLTSTDWDALARRAGTGAWGPKTHLAALEEVTEMISFANAGESVEIVPTLVKAGGLRAVSSGVRSSDPDVRTAAWNLAAEICRAGPREVQALLEHDKATHSSSSSSAEGGEEGTNNVGLFDILAKELAELVYEGTAVPQSFLSSISGDNRHLANAGPLSSSPNVSQFGELASILGGAIEGGNQPLGSTSMALDVGALLPRLAVLAALLAPPLGRVGYRAAFADGLTPAEAGQYAESSGISGRCSDPSAQLASGGGHGRKWPSSAPSPASEAGCAIGDPRIVWALVELLAQLNPEFQVGDESHFPLGSHILNPADGSSSSGGVHFSGGPGGGGPGGSGGGRQPMMPGSSNGGAGGARMLRQVYADGGLDDFDVMQLMGMLEGMLVESLHNLTVGDPTDKTCTLLASKKPLALLHHLAWAEDDEIFVPASLALHRVLDRLHCVDSSDLLVGRGSEGGDAFAGIGAGTEQGVQEINNNCNQEGSGEADSSDTDAAPLVAPTTVKTALDCIANTWVPLTSEETASAGSSSSSSSSHSKRAPKTSAGAATAAAEASDGVPWAEKIELDAPALSGWDATISLNGQLQLSAASSAALLAMVYAPLRRWWRWRRDGEGLILEEFRKRFAGVAAGATEAVAPFSLRSVLLRSASSNAMGAFVLSTLYGVHGLRGELWRRWHWAHDPDHSTAFHVSMGAARAAGDAIVFGAVLRAAPFCVLPAVLVALAY